MEEVPVWLAVLMTAATGMGGALSGSFWERNKTNAEAEVLRLEQQSENWQKLLAEQSKISERREQTIVNMAQEIRDYKMLASKLERRVVELEAKVAVLTNEVE